MTDVYCLECGGPLDDAVPICHYCGAAGPGGAQPAMAAAMAPDGVAASAPAGTPTMVTATVTILPKTQAMPISGLDSMPPAPAPVPGAVPGAMPGTPAALAAPNGSLPPGPTVTFAAPHQLPGRSGIRLGRRSLIAIGLVVVLIVGGTVAYEVLKPTPPSPQAAVQSFFADLANDDTAAALALVDPSAQQQGTNDSGSDGSSGSPTTLLTARSLADPGARPSDANIGTVTSETDPETGATLYDVPATYKAGSSTVTQDIAVIRNTSGHGAPYLLENPLLQLAASNATGQQITVNGIASGTSDFTALVLPGLYTITLQANALFAAQTLTAQPSAEGGSFSGLVAQFATPTLAPGAQSAVLAKITSALNACAASTSAEPQNCPFGFYPYSDDDSVAWSIATYPSPTLTVTSNYNGGFEVDITDEDDGVADYTDNYVDFSGTPQTYTGQEQFGVSGYATASGSTITVSLSEDY